MSFCRAALRNLPAQTHLLLNSATLKEKSTPTTVHFSSVQSLNCVWLFATPWTTAHQASLSITNSQCLFKLMSIESGCHPTISSSVILFFSCLQSFPASGSVQMTQFFASGGQSIGVSASSSVLPMNIQDWFPLELTGSISLQSKGHHLLNIWKILSGTLNPQLGILPLLFTKKLLFPK